MSPYSYKTNVRINIMFTAKIVNLFITISSGKDLEKFRSYLFIYISHNLFLFLEFFFMIFSLLVV